MNAARTARLSRRALLWGGAGLGASLIAGCQREPATPGAGPDLLRSSPPTPDAAPVVTARNLSTARYREVDFVVIRPGGVPAAPMPVCVALHADLRGAKSFLTYGVQRMLTDLVAGGATPFAVAAVDGGNWVGHKDDDPQRMLTEDLPGWLERQDLAGTPFAAIGIDEGGAGVLHLARTPGLSAVAAISPTLFDSWSDAERSKIYRQREQWEDVEPLRHAPEYANLPVGVWCGNQDRDYLPTSKAFATAVGATATFAAGGHDDAYFTRALPEALKFVAGYL